MAQKWHKTGFVSDLAMNCKDFSQKKVAQTGFDKVFDKEMLAEKPSIYRHF